jgi:hypothetical protein
LGQLFEHPTVVTPLESELFSDEFALPPARQKGPLVPCGHSKGNQVHALPPYKKSTEGAVFLLFPQLGMDYDRRQAATARTAGLGSETMWQVLEMWLADVIKQVEGAIPKHLKVDGVRWTPVARGYASVEATGYSKGDLEAKATVSILLDHNSCGAAVHLWYKDVMMTADANESFPVGCNDHPKEILRKVTMFFERR